MRERADAVSVLGEVHALQHGAGHLESDRASGLHGFDHAIGGLQGLSVCACHGCLRGQFPRPSLADSGRCVEPPLDHRQTLLERDRAGVASIDRLRI